MTAIALAPLLSYPTRFTDLGRLRVQESERVAALRTELTKCGANVVEDGDTLDIEPSSCTAPKSRRTTTTASPCALRRWGWRCRACALRDPGCVRKTFPNFFAKLAAPAPGGLGATIIDVATGKALSGDDLLAD